jgi:putative ABC transport system permease protein
MNHNNLKLIWRNLWKNAKFSAINIFGLSISLAVCFMLGLYLHFEYSFDGGNPNKASTYRLLTTFKYPNSPESTLAFSSAMMGPYLQRNCGDIEQYLRIVTENEEFLCRSDRRETTIGKSMAADSTFFSFFNFPLLYGDRSSAFARPENILLTRPVSEALFGTENPIGKTVEYTFAQYTGVDTTVSYLVSGVFDHLPDNSHLQFDALRPLDTRQYDYYDEGNRWHIVVANTYFRLHPSVKQAASLEASFPAVLQKEMPNSDMISLALQPFSAIHLESSHLSSDPNNYLKSDKKYLGVLGLVALFILIISSINFANLSTVLAMKRGQEVGVRKSLGASGGDVFAQFMGEAMLMAVLAGGLALLWTQLLGTPFFELLGRDLAHRYPPVILAGFGGLVLFLGLSAGIYPAMQAARHSALQAFQGAKTAVSVKRPFVQRLVVVQFVLSGILIIGSLICYQQLRFLKNKDLGFKYAQVIELNLGPNNWMRSPAMKKELAALPGVAAVSSSDNSLGNIGGQNGLLVRNPETKAWENHPMSIIRADYNYFDLYEMQLVAGRTPTPEAAKNELEFVVNEAFVKKMGWKDDPIGKEIMRAAVQVETPGRIVGVIKDIHHNDLRHAIEPICIQASEVSSILSLKVETANLPGVLKKVQAVWLSHIKDRSFQYRFMDERFAQLYDTENRLGKALLLATLLSIFIACLGLLALSAFIISQRTKEIGVRKVLGASIGSVVGLLSKDFLVLVVIAFAIASPLAYFFMDKWLQDFAYRIDIQWPVFALAGVVAVAVAFLTVSFQSMKAALANPVKSLRSE